MYIKHVNPTPVTISRIKFINNENVKLLNARYKLYILVMCTIFYNPLFDWYSDYHNSFCIADTAAGQAIKMRTSGHGAYTLQHFLNLDTHLLIHQM